MKKEVIYINDPELGRVPLVPEDMDPEERALLEKDVEDAIGIISDDLNT